jgi:hypothetical protein
MGRRTVLPITVYQLCCAAKADSAPLSFRKRRWRKIAIALIIPARERRDSARLCKRLITALIPKQARKRSLPAGDLLLGP